MRLAGWIVGAVLFAAALAYTAAADSYGVFLVATTALTAVACIGLNVLLGLAGQVSLGHVGFTAIGAYATALLMERAGWSFWAAMPASVMIATLVGGALAMPALRVRGPYLAMVTIAFGFIIEHGAVEWRDLTGGGNGFLLTAAPTFMGAPLGERGIAFLGVCLVALALLLFDRFKASGWGFAMRAARDSEVASRSIGIDLVHVRTAAFMISAGAAALGGALFAPLNGYISPSSFPFLQSILFLLGVMVGGAGTTFGPIVGAFIVVLLPEMLSQLAEYRLLVFGLLLLAVLRLAPAGIVGIVERLLARLFHERAADRPVADDAAASLQRADHAPANLEVRQLSLAFGGVRAVDAVSFHAAPGEVTSIIGPNGAGKTSALNLLCGFYRPDGGTVALAGEVVSGLPSHALARRGIARTFQTTQLFGSLTALENVVLAARNGRLGSMLAPLVRGEEETFARILLAFVALSRSGDRPASALAHGEKRLVEIARALAMRPKVTLLDEPAAGLSQADKQRLGELLRRVAGLGITVILVEHDMGMVMTLSDRIHVLDAGRHIESGTPQAVRESPAVRKAYLGEAAGPVHAGPAARQADGGAGEPALSVEGLSASYGASGVLADVSIEVRRGQAVAVLGANGAGKTTLMRAVAGLDPPRASGAVRLAGAAVDRLPAHRRVGAGLVLVPEGRQVFPELTVLENLKLGAFTRREDVEGEIEAMFVRFPRLRERKDRRAGLLSGGEQQMLAVARGLLASPKVLMLDEPSLGLAPKAAEELFAALGVLREEGMTLVVVDQMATHALALSDHAYLLETGAVVKQGPADELARDPGLEEAYLGGSHAKTAGAEASGVGRRGEPSAGALDISKRLLTNGTTAS